MNLSFSPKTIFITLLKVIGILLICNVIVMYLKLIHIEGFLKKIIYFFDFDWERNLPTFYSSLALLFSSILLFIISIFHKKNKSESLPWLGLSLIFAFLSVDEMTVIHEQLSMPIQKFLNTSGLLYYAWYIPYGILMLILIVIYAKFLIKLPKKVKIIFVLSGVIFATGAIGVESFSGFQDELHGKDNLLFYILCTLEELFEMVGVAFFIYGLLTYISLTIDHVDLRINRLLNTP